MIKLETEIARTLESALEALEDLIRDELVPAFLSAKMDPASGAVVVPGWAGVPESAAYQAAVARSGTALEQHGLIAQDARRLATRAVDYIVRNLWDDDHGGWYDAPNVPDSEKATQTQATVLAALVEFLMVSGDFEVAERVSETFKTLQVFAADNAVGGYASRFTRQWQVVDRKGSEGALAEAFGLAYVALGTEIYRRRACDALNRLVSAGGVGWAPLAPVLPLADLVDADGTLQTQVLAAAAGAGESGLEVPAENRLDCACTLLELWRLTRQTVWLQRFATQIASKEPDTATWAFIMTGGFGRGGALPRVLRIETLLVKALFGSR